MREYQHKQAGGGGSQDVAATTEVDRADSGTTYSSSGPLPPVAADVDPHAAPPPTASERAYAGASSSAMLGFGPIGSGTLPRVPTTRTPLAKQGDLEALTARKDAEALLESKGMDASDQAKRALDILVSVPDSHRGKVIDELAAGAFENLVDRISESDRERFYELVNVSQNPERKLRLWAEAHKARATNNIDRYKGDIGAPIAMSQVEDDDGNVSMEMDEEAEDDIRKTLTRDQLRNRKRHLRRQKAAATTNEEVDTELKELKAANGKNKPSLADVNKLIERKELEYQIELQSNVNLTNQAASPGHDAPHWEKDDLEQVQRTMPRLPQAQDPDGIEELRRVHSRGWGVGGEYHKSDNSIDITDWAIGPTPGFRHGGDQRQLVSDDFKQKNGEKIGTLEFVLTHESGHDADAKHPKAFDAFKKAAGWERVKVDALRDDGVSDEDIGKLEGLRSNPNSKMSDIKGKTRIYSPDAGSKDEYWAVPITAIPASGESEPGPEQTDTWSYARVNPDEHFAEVYAKAVHVPEKLHEELVVKPTEAAAKARDEYQRIKHVLDVAEAGKRSSQRDLKVANLRAMAGALRAEMVRLETARDQRVGEFEVMRNTVFGTDKAVKLSIERLQLKKVSAEKIQAFEERAAAASTPEQVAYLEVEASK